MEQFNQYFLDVVKNHYIDFEGRASRSQFWYYVLFVFIINIIVMLLERMTGLRPILSVIVGLGLLLPGLGISARRLHDIGKSGWWMLVGFVPILGFFALLYFYILPDQEGSNLYGEPSAV